MYKKIFTSLVITLSVWLASSLSANDSYVMDYDKETTCLVRNFKVYENPQWVSKIELTNGKKLFFSSPKSMIEFYLVPGRWFDIGVKSEEDFKDILVTNFATLKPIDARGAFFVYGSNTTSPAGDDLVPFATYEEAKKFASTHNGKRVMSFNQISDALIRLLNGSL
ncbi:nitrous oxide reductase accessory protein NosL [Sulfurimonas sp.]|jgi:nitrous oxide reductase accessory protein NosL|uniref:nitrous oxide reductase accessory protein NosL n=1 Tax=Sulfurimonas sp. TaxID=2022749 RepID=UPI0025F4F698|nr:nitrous oxide reductase accessory protein NosL [Sulfurimonas sp.]MCK9473058.1 nitrous oxide reductase accessory protein NosL [Sulfurimonas sp.]MDD3506580.1 nitrous oxide reductase accessory protein NosL [Sulfurimonas sp.]